jgi:hypothetical protein
VVEAEVVHIGPDILVYVWGGERPHIGAIAAAQPRRSKQDQCNRFRPILCRTQGKWRGLSDLFYIHSLEAIRPQTK